MAEPSPNAAQWLGAARAGSREALGQVLEACRHYLLAVAGEELDPHLQAKGGASDLVQQTFLEAQRDFGRFQGGTEAELLAWLRRLLQNNIADFTRRYRATAKRRAGREVALEVDTPSGAPGPSLAVDTPTPSGQLIARERTEELREALGRLPEEYRRVITLRYQEERSFEEIGRVLQRTPNGARKLWLRAVERLQHELDAPA
jgi:RNA polymerase sigma-70 factor (ECF subfamily)